MHKLRQRLAREEGFTLIELLIVMIIIGILLAIAVPSYLGFKDRANQKAADADVREAVPSAEAFYEDNNTYSNISVASLKSIDSGLSTAVVVGSYNNGQNYCLAASVGGKTAFFAGPGGTVVEGSAPNANCPAP